MTEAEKVVFMSQKFLEIFLKLKDNIFCQLIFFRSNKQYCNMMDAKEYLNWILKHMKA